MAAEIEREGSKEMPKKVLLFMRPNAIVQCNSLPISLFFAAPLSLSTSTFALETEFLLSFSVCISCFHLSFPSLSLYLSLSLISPSLFLALSLSILLFLPLTRLLSLSYIYKLLLQLLLEVFLNFLQNLSKVKAAHLYIS